MMNRRKFLASSAALAVTPAVAFQEQSSRGKLPAAIAALTNRSGEAVPIQLSEREQRVERARALLRSNKADALIITTGSSLTYFTGLRWGQSDRFFAWVLPVKGNPFLVCPAFEEARLRERTDAVPSVLPSAAKTRIHAWNEDEDPYKLLAKALRDAGIATGKLAIEERTQFSFSDAIAHASPALSIVSGNPVTYGCRGIKSPAELALMQLANSVTLSVYKAFYESAHPGMSNKEGADLISAGFSRCGFRGAVMCQADAFTALPHGSLQTQMFKEGSLVLLDDGCAVEGYVSDITRMFIVGKPSGPKFDKQRKVFDIVHAAQAAALAKARPGVPCQSIDAAARAVITDAGYGPGYKYFAHRLGHGIGLDGHEWPYLVGGNPLPLAPGMCFSDEPGIYIPGEFGMRLEDCWHVTEDGGKMFTPPSPSLDQPFSVA